jgi:hypothetical protein
MGICTSNDIQDEKINKIQPYSSTLEDPKDYNIRPIQVSDIHHHDLMSAIRNRASTLHEKNKN